MPRLKSEHPKRTSQNKNKNLAVDGAISKTILSLNSRITAAAEAVETTKDLSSDMDRISHEVAGTIPDHSSITARSSREAGINKEGTSRTPTPVTKDTRASQTTKETRIRTTEGAETITKATISRDPRGK